jgi:hypothetical protein
VLVSERARFAPISDGDWMGYQGAMSFVDGARPLHAVIEVDGTYADVVLDREGMGVHWTTSDVMGDVFHCAYFEPSHAVPVAEEMMRIALVLPAVVSRDLLEGMGATIQDDV